MSSRVLFRTWLTVILVVLALPLVTMIAFSFNESRFGTLPFHFSLEWYTVLANDKSLIEALNVSIRLAAQVTVYTVIIGTMLAMGIAKAAPGLKVPVNASLLIVLTVPPIIFSAGLLSVFDTIGLGKSELSLILASIVTSMPYIVLIVAGRLQDFDDSLVEAARTLGAGPVRSFLRITLPLISPTIIAGGLLSFVVCFNNFVIQLFIAPIGISTLPVQIYSMLRLGVTPDVNALGAIIIGSTVVIIVALHLLTGNAAKLFVSRERN